MKHFFLKLTIFIFICSLPNLGMANVFKIKNVVNGTAVPDSVINQTVQDIEDQINEKFPNADSRQEYLNGMNDSFNLATASTAGTHGQSFDYFLIGFNLGVAAAPNGESITDIASGNADYENLRGVGAQAAITAGLNFGNVFGISSLERLRVYANFMSYGMDFDEYEFKTSTFGLYAQYRLMESRSLAIVKWTGLDVGVGLQKSNMEFEFNQKLNEDFAENVGDGALNGNYGGDAKISADVSTFTMPIEVSTGVRLLYLLKFVGGMGMDLNLGNLTGKGNLENSSFSANYTGTGGGTVTGDAILDVDGESDSAVQNFRGFLGLHLEYGIGSIFVQMQKSFSNDTLGINTGLNFFW